MASEKQRALEKDTFQMRDMMSVLDSRIQLLEERLDFTARLLAPGSRQQEEKSDRAPGS